MLAVPVNWVTITEVDDWQVYPEGVVAVITYVYDPGTDGAVRPVGFCCVDD